MGMMSHLDQEKERKTYVFVLLGIAYCASIGGLGTVVGSPPNMIAAKALNLDFVGWMKLGLPMMLLILPLMLFSMYVILKPNLNERVEVKAESIPWTLIIGALANGGLALAQPLVVSQALSLNQGELTYSKIIQFAVFGFTVYFVLYSLMLFCNHTHNVFRREIQMNMRADLFSKLMTNKDFSEDEKITMLTQDMEYLGDKKPPPQLLLSGQPSEKVRP